MITAETRELYNTKVVSITGVDIDCKGKNGWFKHYKTDLTININGDCFLNVLSKRIGKRYPLSINGDTDTMIEYFKTITRYLKYLKTCEEVNNEHSVQNRDT